MEKQSSTAFYFLCRDNNDSLVPVTQKADTKLNETCLDSAALRWILFKVVTISLIIKLLHQTYNMGLQKGEHDL